MLVLQVTVYAQNANGQGAESAASEPATVGQLQLTAELVVGLCAEHSACNLPGSATLGMHTGSRAAAAQLRTHVQAAQSGFASLAQQEGATFHSCAGEAQTDSHLAPLPLSLG